MNGSTKTIATVIGIIAAVTGAAIYWGQFEARADMAHQATAQNSRSLEETRKALDTITREKELEDKLRKQNEQVIENYKIMCRNRTMTDPKLCASVGVPLTPTVVKP
jgi:hypothetical protein